MTNSAQNESSLKNLVDRMLGRVGNNESPIGSQTDSWLANREAEKLADPALSERIIAILKFGDVDMEQRTVLNRILGFLAKNLQDKTIIEVILRNLETVTDEKLIYDSFMSVLDSNLRYDHHTEIVVEYIDDLNDLVRNAAIRVLGLSNNRELARRELRLIMEDPYDEYGLRYIQESLSRLE